MPSVAKMSAASAFSLKSPAICGPILLDDNHTGEPVDRKARIFKVVKMPVPLEEQPQELQGLPGYEFFTVDQKTGTVREFDQGFGTEAQRDFWLALDDLARDISGVLGDLARSSTNSTAR